MATRRIAPTREYRRHIPVGIKLHACLLLLGFTDEEIKRGVEWDHFPALNQREVVRGKMKPDPNDPHYIRPLHKRAHDAKTFGPGGEKRIHTRGSDISEPRRLDRIAEKHREFAKRVLAPRASKPTKPKSKWPSRPFPSKRRK